MRAKTLLACVLAAICGCGTIEGLATDGELWGHHKHWQVYCGLRNDVQQFKEFDYAPAYFWRVPLAIDFVLSGVLDTLVLPYSIPATILHEDGRW